MLTDFSRKLNEAADIIDSKSTDIGCAAMLSQPYIAKAMMLEDGEEPEVHEIAKMADAIVGIELDPTKTIQENACILLNACK